MPFIPTIPRPTDDLNISQGDLLANNASLDTSFGVDHYKFSDATANNGFHNQVTTPPWAGIGGPPTTALNPIIFAWQYTAPLGVLQFSEGPSGAVPTPLTAIQSPFTQIVLTPGATTNLLDFTGLIFAQATITGYDTVNKTRASFEATFDSSATPKLIVDRIFTSASGIWAVQAAGNILQIKNQLGAGNVNILWSMHFQRLQTVVY